jgi:hypothetical protein
MYKLPYFGDGMKMKCKKEVEAAENKGKVMEPLQPLHFEILGCF